MNTDRNIKTAMSMSRSGIGSKGEEEEDRTVGEDMIFRCAMTKDYKSIIELNIIKEGITFIESGNVFLRQMTSLKRLDLSFNSLTKLDNLECLKELRELNVSYNRVETIDSLAKLVNLKVLNLSHNKIKKLENLKTLRKLEMLQVTGNLLEDLNVHGCHEPMIELKEI